MSVLIKGVEMPLRCFECPCCHTIGYFECVLMHKDLRREHGINISIPDWCPLVEVKTPHGRLGDLDKLEKQFKRAIGTYLPKDPTRHMDIVNGSECRGWTQALTAVQEAKTVIEAEGET